MGAQSSLVGRILLGSLIGGLLGLILLAMGIAIILNAMEGRADESSDAPAEISAPQAAESVPHEEGYWYGDEAQEPEASPTGPDYPSSGTAPPILTPEPPPEPLPSSGQSGWRSIFEEEGARPTAPAPVDRELAPQTVPKTTRPVARPTAPRAAPEAKTEADSLFY